MNTGLLPELRPELKILEASPGEDGEPNWLIHDPTRNRFFRITLEAFKVLTVWESKLPATEFLEKQAVKALELTGEELGGFLTFLEKNELTVADSFDASDRLVEANAAASTTWWKWLIHNYLFIKIPIWRPDTFLAHTAKYVSPLLAPSTLNIIRLLGIVGLILAFRQWEEFLNTFSYFFTIQGAAFFGLTLLFMKTAHELGHAYIAHTLGVRVSSIGVAFLVLFPVLYTDTTDAWRLKNNKDRLKIVLAGVGTELHIAMIATFFWNFAPDGFLKSALFFIATTGWVTSLAVNVNPFMRFDGYYAMADWMNMENLQPRSFALARWHLREAIFGFGFDKPEYFEPIKERFLVLYAYATWMYRFFLFIGIALLVYHFAFKVLGIILFVVEIIWFIGRPVWSEMKQWWRLRGAVKFNKNIVFTLTALGCALLVSSIPWQTRTSIPAVATFTNIERLFAPSAAQVEIVHVSEGDSVSAGQPLLTLSSSKLEFERQRTELKISLLKIKLDRVIAADEGLSDRLVLAQELALEEAKLAALKASLDELTLVAKIDGVVDRVAPLRPGQWLALGQPVLNVKPTEGEWTIKAYANDRVIESLKANGKALWQPHVPEHVATREASIVKITYSAVTNFSHPELLSDYGGAIPSKAGDSGNPEPRESVYEILLSPVGELEATHKMTGVVQIESEAHSSLGLLWEQVVGVLIRESGF